jgi:hypothetical protein
MRDVRHGVSVLFLALACSSAAAQCELDKLLPGGVGPQDRAGSAVGLYGSDVLVGMPVADVPGAGPEAGVVAVYHFGFPGWVQAGELHAAQPAAGDRFGEAIGLFSDLAIVGAPGSDIAAPDGGAAFIFERVTDDWVLTATLTAPDATPGARFGSAVGLMAGVVVVGAPGADAHGVEDAGAACVYEKRNGNWMLANAFVSPEPVAGGAFGTAVAVDTTGVVVGAPGETGAISTGGLPAGTVHVYRHHPWGWVHKNTVQPHEPAGGDAFGASVSLYGDYLVVGAPGRDIGAQDAGSVVVFEGAVFGMAVQKAELEAPQPSEHARFGSTVVVFKAKLAVSAPGSGAAGSGAGEAHLFRRVLAVWTYIDSFVASDASVGDGWSLGLSFWDDSMILGAPYDDDAGTDSGAAYILQPFGVTAWDFLKLGSTGTHIDPLLLGSGELGGGQSITLTLGSAPPHAPAAIFAGFSQADLPFHGGTLVPSPDIVIAGLLTDAQGHLALSSHLPTGIPSGLQLYLQAWIADARAAGGYLASNALHANAP